ncbi:hypothetical protein MUK42_24000 [Musa troglodytarum]|uniref:Uncharacterized protein n=1 Tax=Musa troglodytarum TaxID=320322 RepID=A0A9E7GHR3_9LILI|nr:hypothetical protein MUK42_24000 [Musa troglodytarum]
MAEDLQGSLGYIEVKLSEEANIDVAEDEKQSLRSDSTDLLGKEGKKEEEEESASDGEFIKVEKEILVDVEERSHLLNPMVEVEETSHNANHRLDSSEAHVDSIKMKETNKELELQLETVLGKLKSSEVEKALLISEFDLANDKLEKMTKHCEELELGHKLMKNQILEAEQKYNMQLEALEEALKASYIKDKELIDARESFIELSTELDSSRKRIKALEEELLSSVSKVHQLEELNKHSSLQAESESKKVLELQKMLDLAHANAKVMEGQVNNLQMELKELHNENAEKQHVEEALQSTLLELSISQEKLEISESQVVKLEQELASKDHFICGLSEELNLCKVSQEQLRADVTELENMLSTSRDDLETKLVNFQELELKLQEQVKEGEAVEACFKNQEVQISSLQNYLSDLTREKATLESTVTDLNTKLLENEETHSQLEAKTNIAEQDLKKTDSLLSQALSHKEELNKKIELLEQLYHESRITAEVSAKRNLELEGLVQSSNAAEESIRKQLKESEMKLASSEKKNMELEQQINLAEIKRLDAESEINKLNEKIMELTADNALSRSLESSEDRIGQLESSLSRSSLRNSELEKELNDLLIKCAEHEERATATHLCSIDLEDMIHSSHSRAEDSKKRAGELELLLEGTNSRTKELEQLLSTIEEKHRDIEAQSQQYSSKVSELVTELEAVHQAANDKERELTDILYVVAEDRKKFEDLSNSQEKKLYESENEIHILKNELKFLKEKVAIVQEDLEASSDRERELLEKLRYDGEQLEHHSKALEELTAKNLELNSLNESLIKDSQLKFQEAAASIKQKEMEAKELLEKLKFLEEQLISYKDHAVEATENGALLKVELGENAIKLVSLENNVEELNRKVSEANLRTQQTFAENELLTMENSKLREELEAHRQKVNELDEFSKSIYAEKEATVEKLVSHASTIAELTDERSKCLEIQFATESRLKENEAQLQEALEKYKQRDLEAKDQYGKLLAFETHLRTYEEKVSESVVITSTQQHKLEEAHFKLRDMDGLVEKLESKLDQLKTENDGLARHNLSLTEELATYETKMNKLQVAFDQAVAKKEDVSVELHSFKKETEDLLQLLNSDKEKLQSQITSVMEENNMLNKMHQNSRRELEATIVQLEEKLSEQMARELSLNSIIENLKEELSEKSLMQPRISELEEKLRDAEEQLEHHGKAVEEITARNRNLKSINESLVKDSELRLQEAAESFKQKDSEAKELLEKLKSLQEQLVFYEEQSVEASENVASLKTELGTNTMKLVYLENNLDELKQKLSEDNLRCEQALSENELLATSNSKLMEELVAHQHKVNELNKLLTSISAEKEATVEQLASHASTIASLTDEHSRGLEHQFATESRLKENEAQLHEAIEKYKQRDLQVRDLYEKLLALEAQLRTYEEQASESAVVEATQKGTLEEAHFKLQEVEGLVEQLKTKSDQSKIENEDLSRNNLSLTEKLAMYETEMNELQVALDAAVTEKEDIFMQLHSSKKEMEDNMQLLISDKEKFQSQMTSIMEENNMSKEMHENSRKDLEARLAQLEEKLSEQKAREFSLDILVERLKAELSEKSLMQLQLEQKLRYAEEQLEHHSKAVEELTTRNLELNSLNKTFVKDSEVKLEQPVASFMLKESESRELLEKLKSCEEQLSFYKEQSVGAAENVALLKEELGANAMKQVSLENNIEELKQKVSEANLRFEQTLSENELLTTSNSTLREELETNQHKVNGLNELLKSIHAEKEAAVEQLASHARTIAKLTDEHSRGLELQFSAESRLKENEAQLHEAIEKNKQKDLEARDQSEKLLSLETQLRTYEEQASESAVVATTQKGKLEEAHFRLQELEGFVEQLKHKSDQFKMDNEDLLKDNLSLTEKLAIYETHMNELQVALDAAVTEKEDILMQLHSSKKEIEDLMQFHVSDKEKLQSQITSVMEEHNTCNEMYQNARKELKAAIAQLEEKLSEQKARELSFDSLVESLKAELSEKSIIQSELEQKLKYAGEQLEHHREAVEELTTRNFELNSLNETLVKNSELKLKEAATSFVQKESEVKRLLEMLKSLEEQLAFYKEQAVGAAENVASLKTQLEASTMKLVSLENNVEELKQKVSELNLRSEQTLSENELLATSNSKLSEELEDHQHKVNNLNELLKSIHAEKEAAVEQLASHASTIAKLTDEHSRGLELQHAAESRIEENEAQLYEAIEKHKKKDLEARNLYKKLLSLETQLRNDEQANEPDVAATQKGILEEAHFKLQEVEGLVEQLNSKLDQFKIENEDLSKDNVSLTEMLAMYKSKLNLVQVALDTTVREKEDIIMQLHSSWKELEDIIQSHINDKEKLQSQVTSLMEENNIHNEMHQNVRKELEAAIAQLDERLSKQKSELEQRLRHAGEQVELHRKDMEEFAARNLELNSLNESLIKDSELKLEQAAASILQKESETKELLDKLKYLEEQSTFYKEQAVEATENVTSLKAELGTNALILVSLENNVQQLEQKVSEANLKGEQTLAENELLATSNSKLMEELEAHQDKVNELEELLKSIHAEKEATDKKLASHASTIAKLTDEHSRGLELQYATELRLKENEARLHEAIEKHKKRDLEARDLYEKLLALESQLKTYEEQASESDILTATQKSKLEEAHFKIQEHEGLIEQLQSSLSQFKTENEDLSRDNLSLTKELATYETKMSLLQASLHEATAEKEDTLMQLHSSTKQLEDMMQLHMSDKEKLQLQITSVMEENNMHKEMHQTARKELEAAIAQLEEKLIEQKAREFSFDSLVESLKAELSEKSLMQSDMEKRLIHAGEQLEHHRNAVEELTARNSELNSLNESIIKDSELKLEQAAASILQKDLEVKELLENIKYLEEQSSFYKEQAIEANENVTSLKAELGVNAKTLVSLESNYEELKQQISEANLKHEQTIVENELLATSNSKHREELEAHQQKAIELNEFLKSIHTEKEAAVEQLTSHATTIAKLTEEHSRGLELQFATEFHLKESETQLHEAIEKHKQRDFEAKDLYEKLLALESQLKSYEEHASESAIVAATQKSKLDEAHCKLQEHEGLVEHLYSRLAQFKTENEDLSRNNVSLSEKLATYVTKLNDLQVEFDTAIIEKEDIIMRLHSSNKELDDIMQSHMSDKEKLQSQINSVMEENNMQNKMHQNTRKELEATIAQLEEKLSEQKSDLEQKLRHAEEQLEHHRQAVEELTARNMELSSLNESLSKDSELKLELAAANILQKESEVKELLEKLKSLEEQSSFYKEQAIEATETVNSLKAELGANANTLVSLENNAEELKKQISEANLKHEQTLTENELLATSNSKHREELEAHQQKVIELNEFLKSIHTEKEAAVEQLTSHATTIAKLTEEHSRGLELQFATEFRLKESEAQLHEAIEKHKQRDFEAKDLYEKLLALESQLKSYEEHASESAIVAATQKSKLDEAHCKLQEHEGLVEHLYSRLAQFKTENEDLSRNNISLSEKLATYVTKLNDLQVEFDTAIIEKEDIIMRLHSSNKELEDIMQSHMSDKEKLQSQVNSVLEENNMHNKMHQNTRKELEATIAQLEEKLSEQKSDLEQKLRHAEEQLEHHRQAVEELTARNMELSSLNESLSKDSELKLELAAANILQKESEVKELLEKLKSLEEQSSFYKEQAIEATETVNSLKAELGANANTLVSLENNAEELKKQISEANLKHEQTLTENELLATSNSKHREELEAHQQKVIELNEFLKSIHTEKEAAVEQLTSHATTIAKLTEEHSRGLELQFATEFLLKESEAQLHEAIEKHKQRDFEAKDLYEKLLALESQLKSYEEHASESAIVAATHKSKLDEAHCKLQEHEGLVEHLYSRLAQFKTENEDLSRNNISLSEKLATYVTKLNDLQVEFDTAIIEKEDIIMRLHSSNKELEDIMQSHMSDKEKLQSQVNSVLEENNMHNKMHQNTRKELEATIAQLEEKLSEQKSDLEQKLRHAEEQLEHHRQAVEELTARNMELSSLNESLSKGSELKLELAAANILQKESEVKELLQKLKSLEEQLSFYKEQAIEATETVTSLKAELGANAKTLVSLENNAEELKQQISEANLKHEQTLAENELLGTSNSKLREKLEAHQQKINELNELLKSIHMEKEAAVEQLASHTSTIVKLTEEHSRGLELQFATEFRLKENEAQLHDAIEKQKQRDLEARDLYEKHLALESQLKTYEEQTSESAIFEATQKSKLEEAHFKLQEHEGLVEQLKSTLDQFKTENESLSRENLSLTVELATLKTNMNELQVALEASVTAKEDIFLQLNSSKKEMEDLIQLLISDKEKLQLQITSIMAESNMRNETHNDARKELEETIVQLTQNISEQKAREFTLDSLVESLKSELSEKSLMQSELEQKLRYAGEQLEHHKEAVEELTTRNLELNSLNESFLKNSELKLEQAATGIMQKESEAKELRNKLKSLEEQSAFYKEQAVQATENVASLEAELGANAMTLVSLENNVEELKQKVSEANLKGEQTCAENELLVRSNSMLSEELKSHQHKVNELEELLKSIQAEKEAAVEQLVSHASTIAQLTDEHSRGLELQLATEYRLKENEAQLHEAIDKHKQLDFEARDLYEKLLALECQLNAYEEQAIESAVIAATHKGKLEEAHFKLRELEGLVEQLESKLDQFKTENEFLSRDNLSLTEELATYKTKINELTVAHEAAVTEKEDIFVQLHSSKKEMEDHMQFLLSDKEKLQSQITSVMEENNLHNEMHQNARKELEETIAQLEEKISKLMERESSLDSLVEILKSELSTKSLMQSELEQKLIYVGEQLEHHKKAVEELMTRNLELNSLNESLFKDSELKFEQAAACIMQKESEANELLEKLRSVEEQSAFYREQAVEATENVASLKAELGVTVMKLISLENIVEELKQKVSEANLKGEQTFAENELLATSNSKLREELESHQHKVNELKELLESIHAAKEFAVEQLASHASTLAQMSDEHSRDLEVQLATECRLKENEAQLHEAIEKHKQRDLEARDLYEKLLALETQLRAYEEQASESAVVAATQKGKLEEAHFKLQELEGLVEQLKNQLDQFKIKNEDLLRDNLSLSENLAMYAMNMNELQVALDAAVTQKEDIFMQLCSSKKEMENLMQLHSSDKEKLQSQITSVMVENNMCNEMYHNARKELEATLAQFQEQLSEQKTRESSLGSLVESLKAELSGKSLMQSELEQNLRYAGEQLEHHINAVEELTARNLELNSLNESLVKDSKLKLKQADATIMQKESEAEELLEKLKSAEEQLASQKGKLEEAHSKLQELEGLVEQLKSMSDQFKTENEDLSRDNLSLTEELATNKTRMNGLQLALEATVTEKEDIFMRLHSSQKNMEDLMQLHISDKEKLQSQITSVTEENKTCNKMHQNARKELEATVSKLEEKLGEQKAREFSLDSLAESLKAELSEKSLLQSELEQKLTNAEVQLGHHRNAVEELTARNLELNSLNESLIKDTELKLEQADASILQKESETKELLEKFKSLEEQSTFYKEQSVEATQTVTLLEAELGANVLTLVSLENTIQELKQKVSEANLKGEQTLSENELLATSNLKLTEELEAHQHKVNELNEVLKSIHAEKEAVNKQLTSHASTIEKLTDEHSQGLELLFATEVRLKENEAQLHEATEKHKQRDLEDRDLNEKLFALESHLKIYEEQASELAIVAATQKSKLEEAQFKLQEYEGLVEQLYGRLAQFKTENEDISRDNQSLTEDLATYETKMNKLQEALDEATTEKEDIFMQLHSSMKEMDDAKHLLISDKEKLQSQITSVMEENIMLHEMYQNMRRELETTVQLKEEPTEEKAREFPLNSFVENLEAELAEKSLMQARISELEHKLLLAEKTYIKEIESLVSAAAEKETVLTAKLKDHTSLLQERDALDQQLKEILRELDLVQRTITEQKELISTKEFEMQASMKQTLDALWSKNQHAALLEKQIEELKQKLQEAKTQYKEKVIEQSKKLTLLNVELHEMRLKLSKTTQMERKIAELENALLLASTTSGQEIKNETSHAELKDAIEVFSRDCGLDTSTLLKREIKIIDRVHQDTGTTCADPNVQDDTEPLVAMALKFILGVALVSMIIGIILGKRY